jgi:alpha-glucosidase (family GH31 glycosyl hydrolase)
MPFAFSLQHIWKKVIDWCISFVYFAADVTIAHTEKSRKEMNLLKSILALATMMMTLGCPANKGSDSYDRKVSGHPERTLAVWKDVAPGVWKSDIGTPESINLLDMAGIGPRLDALTHKGSVQMPLNDTDIAAVVHDGKTYLRFPLDDDEQIYGFGLNFQTVHQRGRILRLHLDHYGDQDNGRTHAPVPFYVSSKGYGVLINSARYLDVWIGTSVRKDSPHPPDARDRTTDPLWSAQAKSDAVEILIPARGASVYIFGGPSPLDVVQRYVLFCGGGVLPPKWGLGFWQRVPTAFSDADVRKEVDAFENHDFPLDVIGLEPGWQSRAYPCTYEWDKSRFPHPEQFLQEMMNRGVRLNLWMNPYISPEASIARTIEPYTGSHTVWCGTVPDYTLQESRAILSVHFTENHINYGVSGYKIDECDGFDSWLWPDVATFPSGLSGEQMRQTYPLQLQRMILGLFHKQGKRTYGLVRGSNAGASSFPFVLYSDYYSHAGFMTALVNSSFAGVLWTPEVRSSKTGEEWLRRMQLSCFSPLAMINAWADGTKPWSFPEVFSAVREVALLRNGLLPYLYTAFARYQSEGIPPFRSMVLEPSLAPKPDDTEDYRHAARQEIKDQYMIGEFLLVAPMLAGEKQRKVLLPHGKWYDFYTGRYAGEAESITVTPGLAITPLYVKDGGMIPMIPSQRQLSQLRDGIPLEIRHYGAAEGTTHIYDDDGSSFAYEAGENTSLEVRAIRQADGTLRGTMSEPPKKTPWSYGTISWKWMTR